MRVESVSLSEADMVDFAAACESEKNITTQQAIEKKKTATVLVEEEMLLYLSERTDVPKLRLKNARGHRGEEGDEEVLRAGE